MRERYGIGHIYVRAMRELLMDLKAEEPDATWVESVGLRKRTFYVSATRIGHMFLTENLKILQRM